jgi:hypothetical protein
MEDEYLYLADIYNFDPIYCTNNMNVRAEDEVFKELNGKVKKLVK